MKIIPFPGGGVERPDEAWLTELEAALDGSAEGPRADSWRELRGDVRALAPPISPEFERELSKRIADRSARASLGQPPRSQQSHSPKPPHRLKWPHRRFGWLRPSRPALAAVSVAFAVVVVVLIAAPSATGWSHGRELPEVVVDCCSSTEHLGPAVGPDEGAAAARAKPGGPRPAAWRQRPGTAGKLRMHPLRVAGPQTPGRVQQLAPRSASRRRPARCRRPPTACSHSW